MRKAQAVLVDEVLDLLYRFSHVNGHDGEPILPVSLVQGFESVPLPLTVWSPGRPKVQEDDFATD
jgi:hypothetical protein